MCSGCGLPPRRTASGQVIPLRKCTRCAAAAYHDVACQKLHYKFHKRQCRPTSTKNKDYSLAYRIEPRPGRGNCLVAKRFLRSGQRPGNAPEFAPLVPPVLFENQRSSHCGHCFGRDKAAEWLGRDERYPVLVCPTCRDDAHLEAEIQAVATTPLPRILPSALLVYRLCVAVTEQRLSWEDADRMVAAPPCTDDPDAAVHQQAILRTVAALLPSSCPPPVRLSDLLARLKVNAFTVTDQDGQALGIALYKTAHYINHSCQPNVTQSFVVGRPGHAPALRLTVNRSIVPNDEITIAYMDTVGVPTHARRQELLRAYHFTCQCPACQTET